MSRTVASFGTTAAITRPLHTQALPQIAATHCLACLVRPSHILNRASFAAAHRHASKADGAFFYFFVAAMLLCTRIPGPPFPGAFSSISPCLVSSRALATNRRPIVVITPLLGFFFSAPRDLTIFEKPHIPWTHVNKHDVHHCCFSLDTFS
ncbi:hypothetical protein B0H63DRAFT_197802 [Podospora didyma]|uniref:Uncharacterized protein n=1 Tax=Podospora didyma TaxID=330526 RepID=A0AAE0NGR2_9PEZI|nr:hypothetical protein B0H63DRAFT_197802 [Podospora didyma]